MKEEFSNAALSSDSVSQGAAWLATPHGQTLGQTVSTLLPAVYSSWSRRNQRLLVLNSGLGFHLQCLWEAGFDITAHDDSQQKLDRARSILSHRAEYMLSRPDSLMCDDNFFSYALCLGALEGWNKDTMQAVMRELNRVATCGVIFIYFNALSISNALTKIRTPGKKSVYAASYPVCNPFSVRNTIGSEFPAASCHWHFAPASSASTKKNRWSSPLPSTVIRWLTYAGLPFSLVHGVRVDFTPRHGHTGLILRTENIHA